MPLVAITALALKNTVPTGARGTNDLQTTLFRVERRDDTSAIEKLNELEREQPRRDQPYSQPHHATHARNR